MCRHRKWKLTRGEESDTDSGGESGGEVSAKLLYYFIIWWQTTLLYLILAVLFLYKLTLIRLGRMVAIQTGT